MDAPWRGSRARRDAPMAGVVRLASACSPAGLSSASNRCRARARIRSAPAAAPGRPTPATCRWGRSMATKDRAPREFLLVACAAGHVDPAQPPGPDPGRGRDHRVQAGSGCWSPKGRSRCRAMGACLGSHRYPWVADRSTQRACRGTERVDHPQPRNLGSVLEVLGSTRTHSPRSWLRPRCAHPSGQPEAVLDRPASLLLVWSKFWITLKSTPRAFLTIPRSANELRRGD